MYCYSSFSIGTFYSKALLLPLVTLLKIEVLHSDTKEPLLAEWFQKEKMVYCGKRYVEYKNVFYKNLRVSGSEIKNRHPMAVVQLFLLRTLS